MPQAISILSGAAFTVAVMTALGKLLLQVLGLRFYRQEERLFAFASGAACLSLIVFVLASLHLARMEVFLAAGLGILGLAFACPARRAPGEALPPIERGWRVFFGILFAIFTFVYFINAMAPEISPDGSSYHLGIVSRYLREHGFCRITTNMYAHLSQGVELLYLFAFSIGKHSAASLVHFSFLVALPAAMLCYARRFGFATAGIAGALLVYLSPIVGWDGSTAYIDVAVACVLFVMFYLLQIWDQERQPGLLILIGLLAGFGYAMKYTAFVAVPYAVGFVAWKTFRKGERVAGPVAVVAICALAMMAPWVVRNWIWYGNPVSPFYNQWFPNPYIHVGRELEYREHMAHWGGVTDKWQIPIEATVRGFKLQGLLGPVFLLAPIALLALRYRQGRQLLLAAAVCFSMYPANIGTRFLIPCLPFVSLAMGLALRNWKTITPLLLIAHALSVWPLFLRSYYPNGVMMLERIPLEAALRVEPEEHYLERNLSTYAVARMMERNTPPGAKILSEHGAADAYTSRELLVRYEAALNDNLGDMLKSGVVEDWQPTRRLTFRFSAQPFRRIRLVQTTKKGPPDYWSINEFRVFDGSRELARDPRWRIGANPNPFEVHLAFDNNPMTRWRNWQPLVGGEYLEVDFGRAEEIDSVVLDSAPDQDAVKLKLEGQVDVRAPWRELAGEPQVSAIPAPGGLRQIITRELRRQGIGYLLIFDHDLVAQDLRANAGTWGVVLAGECPGARLYRIQ
jgi:hypothetical protein